MLFTLVNMLTVLMVGRRPEWSQQSDASYPNGLPQVTAGIGRDLINSPKTQIAVRVREFTYGRSARITITYDVASTYTVNVNVQLVAVAGIADLVTTIAAIRDAINAAAPGIGDDVTASAVESTVGSGVFDTLLLIGKAAADWTMTDVSVAGGAGTITAIIDRTSTDLRVFALEREQNGPGTYLPINGASYSATFEGWVDRFDSAGVSRYYVELFNLVTTPADTAGAGGTITERDPDIFIGPAVQE